MALIVCGHQRSGTSLLQRLCDHHPDIFMTNEFGNFFDLHESLGMYRRKILKRWWQAGNRSFFSPDMRWGVVEFSEVEPDVKRTNLFLRTIHKPLQINMCQNLWFVARYLFQISKNHQECINPQIIEAALLNIFPTCRVVGDKHPDYVFILDKLVQTSDLSCVVIYRDPRDMVNSVIKAYTLWGKWWGSELTVAEEIAKRWVQTIELIEHYVDKIHIIRYEELVSNPQPVLTELALWLDVDPKGFKYQMVRNTSVGKHRQTLADQDLANVLRVAGPTMERLGYRI